MNLPARLWAELALVARAEADAIQEDPDCKLKRKDGWSEHERDDLLRLLTPEEQWERDRLLALGKRFAYRAAEQGLTRLGSDYVYGDLSQESFKSCACGQLFEYRSDWEALGLVGEMPGWDDQDRDITLELRNCPCGSTLAVEKRP